MEIKFKNVPFYIRKQLLIIIMRTFIFLCCISAFSFTPNEILSQNKKIKIDVDKTITVDEIFDLIMEQTDYKFIYQEGIFNNYPKVNVKKGSISANKLLRKSLSSGNFDVMLSKGKTVLIKEKEERGDVIKKQQGLSLSGVVSDANGEPLLGANVIERGTNNGTQTDFEGNFSITVSNTNAVLEISYIGFKSQEITVGNQTNFNIVLEEDVASLDEVIVVGFGTQLAGEVNGAVSQIKAEDFVKSNPVQNGLTALQGTLPGLSIQRTSGQPGREGINLTLRDISSINGGNSPLVLIDGIEGSIGLLNPDDIDTVTTLKDAAAAIYGSRAAGGVILITTKKGRKGKPTFEFTSAVTYQRPQDTWHQPTVRQYADIHREAELHEGRATPWWFPNQYYDKLLAGTGVPGEDDWAQNFGQPEGRRMFYEDSDLGDNLFSDSFSQNYTLAVAGGGEKTTYRMSLGYNRTEGFFKINNNISDRYNIRFNYQWDITDWLNVDARIGYERFEIDEPVSSFQALNRYEKANPIQPTFNSQGDYLTWGGFRNPIQELAEGGNRFDENNNVRLNVTTTVKILEGLKFINQTGTNILNFNREAGSRTYDLVNWTGNRILGQANPVNSATFSNSRTLYRNMSNRLEYKKTVADDHNFSVTLGNVYEGNRNKSFNATARNLASNDIFHLGLGDPDLAQNNSSAFETVILSYIGRFSYNYKNKYYIEAVGRRDGSSKFAPANRWGNFGGLLGSWTLSKESFIENLNIFDHLKLRGSIGETGNESIASNYNAVQNINIGGTALFGAGTQLSRASLAAPPSVDGTWEVLLNKNIALDFTVLNNKLSGSVDVYQKINTNMLIQGDFSEILGAPAPRVNTGELRVNGYEIKLNWNDQIGEFKYGVGAIFWDSRNKVTRVGTDVIKRVGLNSNLLGYSTNTYFGYNNTGIIKTQEQLDAVRALGGITPTNNLDFGDVIYEDVDGDGDITPFGADGESGDLVNLGTTNPRYQYSFNINAEYKGFDLAIFGNGIGKRTLIAGSFALPYEGGRNRWHKPNAYYHNWGYTRELVDDTGRVITEARLDSNNPRITLGQTAFWNWRDNRLRAWNGAYLRIKNIALGYTLPKEITKKLNVDNIRLYVNASDVITFHRVPGGFDPEFFNANGGQYPLSQNYVFGAQIKF